MFKKSLAAVAVLGAFAANSMAADVTLYGKVDLGLNYQNVQEEFGSFEDTTEGLTLDSGVGLASRIGLKATEQLGNGDKVAFKLEGDFKADDGDMNKTDRLWQREASLSYSSDWGMLYAGRYGTFSGAAGATDVVMSRMDVFDGGHKDVGLLNLGRTDNSIAYFTPKFAGFQAVAMYSFKNDNVDEKKLGDEGHANTNRFAGLAMTYDIGALQTTVSYEQILRNNAAKRFDDGKLVSFGGNYNFDMFQLFVGGQYFTGMNKFYGETIADKSDDDLAMGDFVDLGYNDGIEGYGLHAGAEFQALGGNWELGMYYSDATLENDFTSLVDIDAEYFGMDVRYIYKLSKQIELRSTVLYDQLKLETDVTPDYTKDRYAACVSLTYNF